MCEDINLRLLTSPYRNTHTCYEDSHRVIYDAPMHTDNSRHSELLLPWGNFISKQYYILWSDWMPLTAIVTVDVMLHQRQLRIKIWVWQAVTTEVQLIKRSIFMTVLQIATGCTQSQSDEAKRNFIARRKRHIPKSGQPNWRSPSAASRNFVHKISVALAIHTPTRWPTGRCHKPFT